MLTLREWCALAGAMPTHPTTERGAVSVCYAGPLLSAAWGLADYRVSSRSGTVIWFVPA